jgi:hypothetical protein
MSKQRALDAPLKNHALESKTCIGAGSHQFEGYTDKSVLSLAEYLSTLHDQAASDLFVPHQCTSLHACPMPPAQLAR